MDNTIKIHNAWQGNLKHVSLEIPRNQLVVLSGVSGSGKSTLAVDVIFQECQRQYLEAMSLQGIQKPKMEAMLNLSPAILITQNDKVNKNPRSSIGTLTDMYTDLRMIYEKVGSYPCPHCHEILHPYRCKEEVEKIDSEFHVYQYCEHCHQRMEKLTRSHFSFNTRVGACEKCQGIGEVLHLHEHNIVNESRSLEDGAIAFWDRAYKEYQIASFYKALAYYHMEQPKNFRVEQFTKEQKTLLLYGVDSAQWIQCMPDKSPPKSVIQGKFEGVYTTLWRRMSEMGKDTPSLQPYFLYEPCDACHGERLKEASRNVQVLGKRLPQLCTISLDELSTWLRELENSLLDGEKEVVLPYVQDLQTKLRRMELVGLSYLSLERQTMTLSGGELQRIKLAATLDCELTGIIYILDEPTIGLHPKDTVGIMNIIRELRDKGNTIILIEHDPDVLKQADYIIDIGPGSGKYGGEIIAQGTLEELIENPNSITGAYLSRTNTPTYNPRKLNEFPIEIHHATLHNLKDIDVNIPSHALCGISGVSGSGKSTLIFDILEQYQKFEHEERNHVNGMDHFSNVIAIHQTPLNRMSRSNVATYSGVYTHIRTLFAKTEDAKKQGKDAKYFSFNAKGGRCDTCEGLGYVTSNMLFFKDLQVPCPICNGKQFHDDVLRVKFKGYSIKDILDSEIAEALLIFQGQPKIMSILTLLYDCGLGYLSLGQSLTTLSGGEAQRLKLAKELVDQPQGKNLYLIDEPTTGLHPLDIEKFLILLQRMVEHGNTIIVVEHNLQLLQACDWIIDLGPFGGIQGGQLIAQGSPIDIKKNKQSITGSYLFQ